MSLPSEYLECPSLHVHYVILILPNAGSNSTAKRECPKSLFFTNARALLFQVAVHLWNQVSGSGHAQDLYTNAYPKASSFSHCLVVNNPNGSAINSFSNMA